MSGSLSLQRLLRLSVIFVGLLIAFSALRFFAQERGLAGAVAIVVGVAVIAAGTRALLRLPRTGTEPPARDSAS